MPSGNALSVKGIPQRTPEILQDAADAMVAWDSYQIIATIQLWIP